MLLFALIRAIEIIGEAASRLSAEIRTLAPDVPWSQITGIRNRLIHAYFDIDSDVVWLTAVEELPRLLPMLQTLATST
jgi:uncharacterized protein with HEPN domain